MSLREVCDQVKVGFERWVAGKKQTDFAAHIRSAMLALQVVAAAHGAQASVDAHKASPRGRTK